MIQEFGPQAADVAFWNANDPGERYAPMRNRYNEGLFIGVHTRLWSDLPSLRPMMTCVEDTVVTGSPEIGFHHHCLIGPHCSAEELEMHSGHAGLSSCHSGLLRAIEPLGLEEGHLRDSISLHRKVRVDPGDGRLHGAPSDVKPGDLIDFYAEIDLTVAVSACPDGDGSRPRSRPEDDPGRALRIEMYDTGIQPNEFPAWDDWRSTWQGRWEPPSP